MLKHYDAARRMINNFWAGKEMPRDEMIAAMLDVEELFADLWRSETDKRMAIINAMTRLRQQANAPLPLVLTDEYLCGNRIIDEHRRTLVQLINDLDRVFDTPGAIQAINWLEDYAVKYFEAVASVFGKNEEMESSRQELFNKLAVWKEVFNSSGDDVTKLAELREIMRAWLKRHVAIKFEPSSEKKSEVNDFNGNDCHISLDNCSFAT